jgi:ADP-heptose:LPS heptosyltransferase
MGGADGDLLVLRALGLGDLLTGVPALRGLRRAFPARRLVLAAPPAVGGWMRDLGVVDEVLPTRDLEPLTWDRTGHVAVDLHGKGPASHRLLLATRPERVVAWGCGEVDHDGPTWRLDEHEVERWCRLVRGVGGDCGPEDLRLGDPGPRVGADEVLIHPGAAFPSRCWPVDRWADLADRLVRDGHRVVVTGSAGERDLAETVLLGLPPERARSTAGDLELPGLADLVGGARLVVCGDTGVAHVATAYGTPSVLLFGPTPPQWWGPAIDPALHTVLWHGDLARRGDPHGRTVDPALAAITLDEVTAAVEGILTRTA